MIGKGDGSVNGSNDLLVGDGHKNGKSLSGTAITAGTGQQTNPSTFRAEFRPGIAAFVASMSSFPTVPTAVRVVAVLDPCWCSSTGLGRAVHQFQPLGRGMITPFGWFTVVVIYPFPARCFSATSEGRRGSVLFVRLIYYLGTTRTPGGLVSR